MPLNNNEILKQPERNLLARTMNGDEDAFKELYDLLHKKVYFYLYRMLRDKEAAEDVMVETFTEVWKSAKNYRGDSKVMTWVCGIARNLAMNELRTRKVHDDVNDHPQISGGTIPDAEASNRRKILKDSMSKISHKHREILDLVFYHEMDYQGISDTLDIPVNTVKTRVYYAKDALKNMLVQMGVKKDDI